MRQHARSPQVPDAEDGSDLLGRDAVEAAAQPGVEVDVLVGLKQQRVQAELAELPIAFPGRPRDQPGDRRDVDERRPAADELDVVRRAVLQDEPVDECGQEHVELEQGGVLQHAERPLIRV